MVVELNFEVSGQAQIARRLERFERNLKDARPAFREMHRSFLTLEKRQFDTQGRSGSRGWKAISPSWVAKKKKMMADGTIIHFRDGATSRPVIDYRILHMTHRLRDSLTNSLSPDHISKITKDQMVLGTKVPYAMRHQLGKGVAKRPPIELNEANKKEWVKILQRHLVEATRG